MRSLQFPLCVGKRKPRLLIPTIFKLLLCPILPIFRRLIRYKYLPYAIILLFRRASLLFLPQLLFLIGRKTTSGASASTPGGVTRCTFRYLSFCVCQLLYHLLEQLFLGRIRFSIEADLCVEHHL